MPNPFVSSSVTGIHLSNINTIDALISDFRWTNSTITYSFPTNNSTLFWSTQFGSGYDSPFSDGEPWSSAVKPLTSNDQINFERALQQWANIANLNFIKVPETPDEVGDIRTMYSEDPDEFTLAWSYLPDFVAQAGDIWMNTRGLLNFQEWDPGSLSFETLLHEIGHALGFKHPFFNADDPTAITLPANLDNTIHTIMSYTYADLSGNSGNEFSFHPTTPMVLDIASIQYIYGANNNFHVGNEVYSYDDINLFHETLWDAGGTDTIQYTGTTSASIDLKPTGESFIGQPVYVQSNGVNVGSPIPNIWIANGVTIENAISGQGNDFLAGNDNSNILDGGLGIDTVRIQSQRDHYTISKVSNSFTATANINPGNQDTLTNIERLQFDDTRLALDLDGHAGQVAKLLGAVFGASTVNNHEYVGIGLLEADKDLGYEQLGEFAINAAGFTDYDDIVTQLWHNLSGTIPTTAEKSTYVNLLDNNYISTGGLAILAADSESNVQNINLTGLIQTGIAFV